MKILNWLNCNHHYDPATWPRAVLGVCCVLVFVWMSLGLRWLWSSADSGNIGVSFAEYRITANSEGFEIER